MFYWGISVSTFALTVHLGLVTSTQVVTEHTKKKLPPLSTTSMFLIRTTLLSVPPPHLIPLTMHMCITVNLTRWQTVPSKATRRSVWRYSRANWDSANALSDYLSTIDDINTSLELSANKVLPDNATLQILL